MSNPAVNTLDKIAGEFEQEVLKDLQDSRAQALALLESARRETREETEKIITTGSKQGESLRRQIIGTAELDVRNSQLRAMEEAVNDVIDTALSKISRAGSSRYENAIHGLIEEGIEVIGPQAVVSCRASDRATVESALRKLNKGHVKVSISADEVETSGGVVLTADHGSVRYDNTFEARLERMKPTLRKDVAALLSRPM